MYKQSDKVKESSRFFIILSSRDHQFTHFLTHPTADSAANIKFRDLSINRKISNRSKHNHQRPVQSQSLVKGKLVIHFCAIIYRYSLFFRIFSLKSWSCWKKIIAIGNIFFWAKSIHSNREGNLVKVSSGWGMSDVWCRIRRLRSLLIKFFFFSKGTERRNWMDSSYKRVKFIAYSNAFSEGPPAVNESTPTEKKRHWEKET